MPVNLSALLGGRVAFLSSELQDGVVGDLAQYPQLTVAAEAVGLVANAARLADAARARGAPVLHCTVDVLPNRFGANGNARLYGAARKSRAGPDSRKARPAAAIWREGDVLLPRYHGTSPLQGGELDSMLRNERVDTLILCGVSVCFGILNTTFDAVNRGYQVILPRDGVAGFPQRYAEQVLTHTLSMLATLATTDEILAAWPETAAASA
jgi:nicotinamidase-related amidase